MSLYGNDMNEKYKNKTVKFGVKNNEKLLCEIPQQAKIRVQQREHSMKFDNVCSEKRKA